MCIAAGGKLEFRLETPAAIHMTAACSQVPKIVAAITLTRLRKRSPLPPSTLPMPTTTLAPPRSKEKNGERGAGGTCHVTTQTTVFTIRHPKGGQPSFVRCPAPESRRTGVVRRMKADFEKSHEKIHAGSGYKRRTADEMTRSSRFRAVPGER
ncbi:hypothetical protein B0H19DRAFT_1231864 [Mycena capillaripes]|nr:hypothetical protein B0H19DRAFT_1231864 [Mycena capillaripes]